MFPADAEVDEFDFFCFGVVEDVLGFDVAMGH